MKTLFEQLGGTYTQQGNYLLPNVKLPEQEDAYIGIWGQRRKQYLLEHHRAKYYSLLTSCRLVPHLADVERRAQKMFLDLTDEIAKQEHVTEQLKADNMLLWVQKMNNIRNSVTEIVNEEIIFA